MTFIQHSDHFITSVLCEARNGNLALPVFQRGVAWDEADVLSLLDSIWRGYPVGYLLFWGDCRRHVDAGCVRGFRGGAPPDDCAALVLDGQQRIQALIDATELDSGYYFDVGGACFSKVSGRNTAKLRILDGELPCHLLLEWQPFYRAMRPLYEKEAHELIDVLESVHAIFKNSRIGSIFIPPEKDETFAREVFRRLNTSGKPFSEDEVFRCLRKKK